jgi:hypothetical protein
VCSSDLSVFLFFAVFFTLGFKDESRTFRKTTPRIVLWAWERPENLNFIDPKSVGVAFLAQTIELSHDKIEVHPRLQSLRVPDGTRLIAVVRISTGFRSIPTFSNDQLRNTEENILRVVQIQGIRGVQIDFDATVSERMFYRSLLDSLRHRLPDSLSLSITALASWCLGDPWIADLPVDDAVPMLFRLGPDRVDVLEHLQKGGDFSVAVSRQSVGVSTDEPRPAFPPNRRVYIFNPTPWNSESYQRVVKEFGK